MAKEPMTQENRLLALTTPLGKDMLCVATLEGSEAVSELFRIDLGLVSDQAKAVSFADIIGKKVTIAIELPDRKKRYINGIVSRFAQGGFDVGSGQTHY